MKEDSGLFQRGNVWPELSRACPSTVENSHEFMSLMLGITRISLDSVRYVVALVMGK